MFEQKYEIYQFLSENSQFLEVKFSILVYLNMRVFVISGSCTENWIFLMKIVPLIRKRKKVF